MEKVKKARERMEANRVEAPLDRRGLLTARQKENMLAILIRNRVAFEAVRLQLRVKQLLGVSRSYAIIWKALCELFDDYAEMPTQEMLIDHINWMLDNASSQTTDAEVEAITEFLAMAFDAKEFGGSDISVDVLHAQWAIKTTKRFLEEQLAYRLHRESINSTDRTIAEMSGLLDRMTAENTIVQSLVAPPMQVLFPLDWDKRLIHSVSKTGISLFDFFLGGGHVGGEVYTVMAPIGSCKTLLAIMGFCEGVRLAAETKANSQCGDKYPKAVLVSYEAELAEVRERCLSYLAKIPRTRLLRMKSLDDLRFNGELLGYEKKLFARQLADGQKILSEVERIDGATKLINDFGLFLPMTNTPEHQGRGTGGVLEIEQTLRSWMQRDPTIMPTCIWIDHAAAMASAMVEMTADTSILRRTLKSIPDHCRKRLAQPLNCPVWIFQQLSGEANSRRSAMSVDHTDSEECKSFAQYCDFAFVTAQPTDEQLIVLRCTKHRREPRRRVKVAKIDGAMSRLLDVDSKYTVAQNMIVLRSEVDMTGEHGVGGIIGGKGKGKGGSAYTPQSRYPV